MTCPSTQNRIPTSQVHFGTWKSKKKLTIKPKVNCFESNIKVKVKQFLFAERSRHLKRRNRDITIDTPLLNQNLLAITTAPGALLSPIDDKSLSTIDLAFVLNVRESELYPPLVLAKDVECTKKYLANNKHYFANNKIPFQLLERNALKECIEQRLPNLSQHENKFEPQIVVTRLSIACACDTMKNGEKCSTLNKIDKQKWTEFMGNLNNGVY